MAVHAAVAGISNAHPKTMIIAAILFVVGVIAEFWAITHAPFGYQDDSGFHPSASIDVAAGAPANSQ